ncbi:hypothetical protein KOW79_018460 [Hemibagrus wyckioides]|uniref:Immunoglobulin domain-containing protein n=1 Tax=Hemibagrus wyckioides TaxID=337641 RepID=A0A9D3NCV3_9TELE|nr:hypothetical protein KOW79_018460 [Hemibagrus wyckioides]
MSPCLSPALFSTCAVLMVVLCLHSHAVLQPSSLCPGLPHPHIHHWSKEGFNISHDQYLRGDSSLTITAADYSQRNVYACECEDSDFSYVRLIIETVFSPVQMESGEDLKLHVSVPEPVEVIYKSSGSADEVICSVNNRSLQCKDKYRDRTSLTYPELTLRHMEPRDSGRYTIRDTKNEEDIQIYAVSVEEPAVPVWGIVLIVMSLLCCAAVGIYFLWRYLKRKQLKRQQQLVEQLVHQAVGGTEENIREVEKSLNQLKQQYINTGYLEELNRRLQHVVQLVQKVKEGKKDISEVEEEIHQLEKHYKKTEYSDKLNRRLLHVHKLVQWAKEGKKEMSDVEMKTDQLRQLYINTKYSDQVSKLCDVKKKELNPDRSLENKITKGKLKEQMLQVKQRVHEAIRGGIEEKISEVEKEINQLEERNMTIEDFREVSEFCMFMKAELFWYRILHSDNEQLKTENIEILWKLEEVMTSLQKVRDGEQESYILSYIDASSAPGSGRGGVVAHHHHDLPQGRYMKTCEVHEVAIRSKEGFNISHDQYLRGDSSLTITAADYSQRNVYACECEDSDFSYVRLIIETVFSPVQMKFGEDLKLHVSVPEPVEVIYKSSGSADEVICRVNNRSLQCKDKYRDRTSLTYPELTLRHMEPRDSGSYTIRDTKNEEDIQIYAVSVEAVFSQVQMKFGEDLKLHVSVPEPVEVIYKSSGSADEVICRVNNLSLQCKDKYRDRTSLTYPELTLRHMEPRDSGSYTIRDTKNEEDIQIYAVSVEDKLFPAWGIVLIVILLCGAAVGIYLLWRHRKRQQLNRRLQLVDEDVQRAVGGTEENIRGAEEALKQLEEQYSEYSAKVKLFCSEKRKQLFKRRLQLVDQLVQRAEGGTEKNIREAEEKLSHLQEQYTEYANKLERRELVDQLVQRAEGGTEEMIREAEAGKQLEKVKLFCSEKRKQLFKRRLQQVDQLVQRAEGGTEKNIREAEEKLSHLQEHYNNTGYSNKLKRRLQQVDQLVQRAEGGTEKNIREVEKSLNHLQEHYKDTEYSDKVELFCREKKKLPILCKVEELTDALEKVRVGGEREQKIPSSTEVYKMKKDLMEIKKWSKEGFNISHDQYLRGDSSLTITAADYSQRNVYACECEDSDFSYVRLIIETVFSQVQMESGEDLKLHVSVPEPVEVIYKSSGSADEVICRLNRRLQQVLQLAQQAEEGTEENITEAEQSFNQLEQHYNTTEYSEQISMLCTAKKKQLQQRRERLRRKELKWRMLHVEQLVQQAKEGTEEKIREAEEAIDELEQEYEDMVYSDQVSVLCTVKREQLKGHQYSKEECLITEDLEAMLKRRLGQVDQLVQQAVGGTEEKIDEAEMSVDQLKQQYINTEYSDKVKLFCNEKRKQLQQHRERLMREELERRQQHVEQLVQQAEEGTKENIREAKESLDQLKQQYENTEYSDKLNKRLLHVNQLVQQAEGGTQQNIREAEKELDQLEQQYKNKDYSEQIKFLCRLQRQQEQVEQFVQQAKDGKIETIREAKVEIDHLEQMQYLNTKNVVPVTPFSMLKRAELYWYRLLNSDDK